MSIFGVVGPESGEICRELFYKLPDALIVTKFVPGAAGSPADFTAIDVNKAFEEMVGLPRQQIIGHSLLTLGREDYFFGGDWRDILTSVAESGINSRFEYYFLSVQRWCDILIYYLEQGYVAVLCRNITEKVRERDRRQAVQGELTEKERRLRILIDKSREGIVILDQEHRVLDANRCFCEMLGYSLDEVLHMRIWDWEAITTEEELRSSFSNISELNASFETRHRRKDGTEFDVEVSVTGSELSGRNVSICICRDITERKQMEEEMRHNEAKFRSFVENAGDIIYTIDKTGRVAYISPNVSKIAGYDKAEIEGSLLSSFMHADDAGGIERLLEEAFNNKRPTDTFEYRLRYKDNTLCWHSLNWSLVDYNDAESVLIGVSRNIAERKIYQEHLEHLSVRDHLTGLYNRTFFDRIISRLQHSDEYPISILSADLNGFKHINDTYGHQAGDKVLQDTATILKSSLRATDMVARIGGDEFVVILPKTDEETCTAIIQRIQDSISRYNMRKGEQLISLSIGAETTQEKNILLTQSYKMADNKMYEEKRSYKEENAI